MGGIGTSYAGMVPTGFDRCCVLERNVSACMAPGRDQICRLAAFFLAGSRWHSKRPLVREYVENI